MIYKESVIYKDKEILGYIKGREIHEDWKKHQDSMIYKENFYILK